MGRLCRHAGAALTVDDAERVPILSAKDRSDLAGRGLCQKTAQCEIASFSSGKAHEMLLYRVNGVQLVQCGKRNLGGSGRITAASSVWLLACSRPWQLVLGCGNKSLYPTFEADGLSHRKRVRYDRQPA